ncbi:unnamed protein product [Ixodes hexagonus]
MVICCVPRCRSQEGKTNVSFHQFPADTQLQQKWVAAITRNDPLTRRDFSCSKVCGLHFLEDDISPGGQSRRRLRAGAVPALFPSVNGASGPEQSGPSAQQPFPVKLTVSGAWRGSGRSTVSLGRRCTSTDLVASVYPAKRLSCTDSAETITPTVERECPQTIISQKIKRGMSEPADSASEASSSDFVECILSSMEPGALDGGGPSANLTGTTKREVSPSSESMAENEMLENNESATEQEASHEACSAVPCTSGVKRDHLLPELTPAPRQVHQGDQTMSIQRGTVNVATKDRNANHKRCVRTKNSGVQADTLGAELKKCRLEMDWMERKIGDLQKQVLRAETKLVTLDKDPTYQAFQAVLKSASASDAAAQFVLDQLLSFNKERPTWHESSVRLCATWRHANREGYEHARSSGLLNLPSSATVAKYVLPP